MSSVLAIKDHINHVSHELEEIRKLVIGLESNIHKSNQAWDDLMLASEEISSKWIDDSAVEEIRSQREKSW